MLSCLPRGTFSLKGTDENIKLVNVSGISQQAISYKLNIVSFVYAFTNIGNFIHPNLGLLHCLELTRLHHKNIVIEER